MDVHSGDEGGGLSGSNPDNKIWPHSTEPDWSVLGRSEVGTLLEIIKAFKNLQVPCGCQSG